jgi:hypothetical protein
MTVEPFIRSVFGPFQNLNLLILLEDLRSGRTAQGNWSYGDMLCPVAHGLPAGQLVQDLETLDQAISLGRACDQAARHLGADPASVYRFVRSWDAEAFGPSWLQRQLEALWDERQADADAVQTMLLGAAATEAVKEPGASARSEFLNRPSSAPCLVGHCEDPR